MTAEGQNNITLECQAIARGLDEQQLRDLPRNSRDIQDFLTLNPNVVGGFDAIQFLGGRTYGASYIQDGQPSSAGIFGELSNAAPGLDAIAGSAGALELLQRRVRRARRRHRLDQARRQPAPRLVVLRLQRDELNARTYAQTLNGVVARRSQRRHARSPLRHQHRRADHHQPHVLLRQLRGQPAEAARRRRAGGRADRGDARGDFSGAAFVLRDPRTGLPFPGNRIPADRLIRPRARSSSSLPAAEPAQALPGGYGTYRQILPLERTATAPTAASTTS